MRFELTRKSELSTSTWSGGTTTQLAIFPSQASYSKGDYRFRLSTAKVEVEESNFTSLPGVSRIIMILNGVLELNHKNHYSKTLYPFETDSFEGDWETCSKGQVTDFNLMTTSNAEGSLSALLLEEGQGLGFSLFDDYNVISYYCVSGEMEIRIEHKSILISEGDIILLYKETRMEDIELIARQDCQIVESRIKTR